MSTTSFSPPRSSRTASTSPTSIRCWSIEPTASASPSSISCAVEWGVAISWHTAISWSSSDRVLSPEARKRLDAIREFTELGAGFRVAGRDLEIRGAGNLLGAEQSGHIAAVGIETYLRMLEETVAELNGEAPEEELPSVVLDLPVPMSIPEDYVGDPNLRIELYRRLASAEEERADLLEELRERFGPVPPSVETLVDASRLKRRAEALKLQAISARGGRLVLRLRQDSTVSPETLIAMVSDRPDTAFSPSGALTLGGVVAEDAIRVAAETLEALGAT